MKRSLLLFVLGLILAGAGWLTGAHLAEAAADGEIFNDGRMKSYGAWRTTQVLGSVDGDPVLKAWVARTAILPLASSEVSYFISDRDRDGVPFDPDCTYRVDVPDLEARWWSVAAYDGAYKPIRNQQSRYSINSDAGTNSFILSRTAPEGETGWIPLGEAEAFELLFRVYQPGETFRTRQANLLPIIERLGAC